MHKRAFGESLACDPWAHFTRTHRIVLNLGTFQPLRSINVSTLPHAASLLIAASLGAMLFFSAIVTPVMFRVLAPDHAGRFLRAVFPLYFLMNGGLAAVAGLLALHPLASPLLLAAAAVMIAVRVGVIPVINRARDAMAGGEAQAKRKFDMWHRASVVINLVEMVGLIAALVVLAR